ncbi:MAG: SIMPL domain-containing protein [Prevotellaceae bacterium]|jgi:uncharacterized protein YggE|nr:SIMPL domain-containing protein [Prevotellaceae bacterium]
MKKAVKFLCFGFGVLMLSFVACAQNDGQANAQSYVEVAGTAEKEVDPDIFYLGINLSETNKATKNDLNAQEQRLLKALQLLGIDTKADLAVTGMSGDNGYWWRKKPSTVYQNKSYQLKLDSLVVLNKVCDKLDSLKINYYLSKVDYSKLDELKKEVQQQAVKQARLKAENLLSAESRKVDELVYLQEQVNNSRFSANVLLYETKSEVYDEAAPGFDKMKVSYSVVARFSIK